MTRQGGIASLVLALLLVAPHAALAVTLAWEDKFGDGQVLAAGTQATEGGVTLDFTTSVVSDSDGGTFDLALFTGEAGHVTVNHATTGAHDGFARMSFNNENDDPADYVSFTISFDFAVSGLQFSVLDIDSSGGNNWDDGVEITYNGGLNVVSAGLFTLPGGTPTVLLDNEPGYLGFEGWNGRNAASGETTGNVDLDFGTTAITDVTIRYFSTDDATANPSNQQIGISDLTWLTAIPEPDTSGLLALGLAMLAISGRRRS